MESLQTQPKQTPIEIALQIDEEGVTTARKLYGFLEMDKSNFSKWCKRNITENEFAEEDKDYVRLVLQDETPTGGKIEREDFKLTAAFAKKLAMTAKNEKGEQARDYFIKVEDKLKESAINMSSLSKEMQALITHDKKIQLVMDHMENNDKEISNVKKDLDNFIKDLPILGIEETRITTAVKRKGVQCLGGKLSNAYMDKSIRAKVYADIYGQLKREFSIGTYKAIKRNQCDVAVDIVNRYSLPMALESEIENANLQINLEV